VENRIIEVCPVNLGTRWSGQRHAAAGLSQEKMPQDGSQSQAGRFGKGEISGPPAKIK